MLKLENTGAFKIRSSDSRRDLPSDGTASNQLYGIKLRILPSIASSCASIAIETYQLMQLYCLTRYAQEEENTVVGQKVRLLLR